MGCFIWFGNWEKLWRIQRIQSSSAARLSLITRQNWYQSLNCHNRNIIQTENIHKALLLFSSSNLKSKINKFALPVVLQFFPYCYQSNWDKIQNPKLTGSINLLCPPETTRDKIHYGGGSLVTAFAHIGAHRDKIYNQTNCVGIQNLGIMRR